MKTQKITMQTIADRLNISKNAVSLALNGKPGVSEETRQLVISLANKLGYSTNVANDALASRNFLVLIPEYIRNDRYFYNDIYWSIDNNANKAGYNTIIATVTPQMEQALEMPKLCEELHFLGILLVGVFQKSYVTHLASRYPHILSVDHCYYNLSIPCLLTANLDGSYIMTKRVLSYGHTEVGFIGSTLMTSSIYERWCGFCLAMQENSLPINESYCITQNSPLNNLFSTADELAALISQMPKLPTAFVCGGDRIAIACINALQSLNIHVPKDISVVGFDDIEIGQYIVPKLTTMHVKRHHMGKAAIAELIKMVHKQPYNQKICIYPELIMRDSLAHNIHPAK